MASQTVLKGMSRTAYSEKSTAINRSRKRHRMPRFDGAARPKAGWPQYQHKLDTHHKIIDRVEDDPADQTGSD